MSHKWPYLTEDYRDLLEISDLINTNLSLKDTQSNILKATMSVFAAESGQFCLHKAHKHVPDKSSTSLINLSWKYTEQYIQYYHQLDPFTQIEPGVSVCRDIDIMPKSVWQNHEFYRDFIQPQKIRHIMVVHIRNQEGLVGHIGLHRYEADCGFSQKELLKAHLLSVLFSRNLIRRHLFQQSSDLNQLLKQILEIPSVGIVVLDSQLNPLYWNRAALELDLLLFNPLEGYSHLIDRFWPSLPPEIQEECQRTRQSLGSKPGLAWDDRFKFT